MDAHAEIHAPLNVIGALSLKATPLWEEARMGSCRPTITIVAWHRRLPASAEVISLQR